MEALSSTKLQAKEELKVRIMHQIQVENALKPRPVASPNFIKEYFTTLGVAYGVILLLGLYLTVSSRGANFESRNFVFSAILIMFIAGMYGLVNYLMGLKRG